MLLVDTTLSLLTSPVPIPGEFNHVAGRATLQDLVYFGAAWTGLDEFGFGVELRNGWQNAVVHRTDTANMSLSGGFYAGQVEHVDATGKITDVVLSFKGWQQDAEAIAAMPAAAIGRQATSTRRASTSTTRSCMIPNIWTRRSM